MGFNNGVPITVVGSILNMPVPTELTARRRAEEDGHLDSSNVSNTSTPNTSKNRCRSK
jgi:hypothetical protein